MIRNMIIFVATFCAAVLISGGCKKSEDNMALLLAGLSGSGPDVYAGSSPEGDFIEVTIDRSNQTIDFIDHTVPENSLEGLAYVWQDPALVPDAGGFSIFYRVELPESTYTEIGEHVLCAEIPGVAIMLVVLDEGDNMLEPPTFAFKRKDVTLSRYYKRAFNVLHVTSDDEDEPSKLDMMCGFAASDSSDVNGRLYGAEYSIQDDMVADLNPEGLGIGDLVKEAESGAFVWWTDLEPHSYLWEDSIVMIGDPTSAAQLIYGENQGGGGAFTIPQASTKDFQSAYAGTYAAILYQYDKGEVGDEESFDGATVVIEAPGTPGAKGTIKVFEFGADTGGTPAFDAELIPAADYDGGEGLLVNAFNSFSLLNDPTQGASFDGIKDAYQCHGAFIASTQNTYLQDVTIVVLFDPEGGFAGFHIYDCDESGDGSDDILSFGLAIKDKNFVSPE